LELDLRQQQIKETGMSLYGEALLEPPLEEELALLGGAKPANPSETGLPLLRVEDLAQPDPRESNPRP
jgi:hypothetical protein